MEIDEAKKNMQKRVALRVAPLCLVMALSSTVSIYSFSSALSKKYDASDLYIVDYGEEDYFIAEAQLLYSDTCLSGCNNDFDYKMIKRVNFNEVDGNKKLSYAFHINEDESTYVNVTNNTKEKFVEEKNVPNTEEELISTGSARVIPFSIYMNDNVETKYTLREYKRMLRILRDKLNFEISCPEAEKCLNLRYKDEK